MTIYAITGDSGTGKTNVVGQYLSSRGIKKLVTVTTRPPKEREVDGEHYHFRTKEEFESMNLIGHTLSAGHMYGTREGDLEMLMKNSPNIYVVLDRAGVKAFKRKYKESVITIKLTTDVDTMVNRLRERGEDENEIIKRVQLWHRERDYMDLFKYDYSLKTNTKVVTEVTDYIDKILEITMD